MKFGRKLQPHSGTRNYRTGREGGREAGVGEHSLERRVRSFLCLEVNGDLASWKAWLGWAGWLAFLGDR